MAEILRDSIWQFIGAVLGLIAIIVSIYVFYVQKLKKSLAYQVVANTELLTVSDEIRGKLQILYDNVLVQNVNLLIIKIENDGNAPITSTDYEHPLNFSFGKECKILSAEVIDKSNKSLKPELLIETTNIQLQPMLLNSKDSLTIKLLITHYQNSIEAEGRIIGVKDIKKVKEKNKLIRSSIFAFVAFSLGIVVTMISGLLSNVLQPEVETWIKNASTNSIFIILVSLVISLFGINILSAILTKEVDKK